MPAFDGSAGGGYDPNMAKWKQEQARSGARTGPGGDPAAMRAQFDQQQAARGIQTGGATPSAPRSGMSPPAGGAKPMQAQAGLARQQALAQGGGGAGRFMNSAQGIRPPEGGGVPPPPQHAQQMAQQQRYAQRAMGAGNSAGAKPMAPGGAFGMRPGAPGGMTKSPMMTGRAQPFAGRPRPPIPGGSGTGGI